MKDAVAWEGTWMESTVKQTARLSPRPEDLEARVKELEDALKGCEKDFTMLSYAASASYMAQLSEDAAQRAIGIRAILNKKPA